MALSATALTSFGSAPRSAARAGRAAAMVRTRPTRMRAKAIRHGVMGLLSLLGNRGCRINKPRGSVYPAKGVPAGKHYDSGPVAPQRWAGFAQARRRPRHEEWGCPGRPISLAMKRSRVEDGTVREVLNSPSEPSMPSVIACPSCAGQLRLPDELIGQQVRCPTCSNVSAAAPAPAAPPAPEPEPRNGSHPPPDLSLEAANDRQPEPAAAAPRGLVGAVELKLSLDDEGPQTKRAPEPPDDRDRDDEGEGSLRPCPARARRIHRGSTPAYHCGWPPDGGRRT